MATLTMDELMSNLKSISKNVNKELDKLATEDAEYLKTKIYESFDNAASTTLINGYYLEGAGSVYNDNTLAWEGTYNKEWQKPEIKIQKISNGASLNIIGTDAKLLEYGIAPFIVPQLRWIHNIEEGKTGAHNSEGAGNWFAAISLSIGNENPLVSYGKPGTRFFARDSAPTMFIRKACQEFTNDIKSDKTSVHITPSGVKTLITRELNK